MSVLVPRGQLKFDFILYCLCYCLYAPKTIIIQGGIGYLSDEVGRKTSSDVLALIIVPQLSKCLKFGAVGGGGGVLTDQMI